jgi:hypothetical protein
VTWEITQDDRARWQRQAAARRGGVMVRVTATVFDGHDDDVAVIW